MVPNMGLDRGFWYGVPEHLRLDVEVGSMVRIPLSGRRVKGYVVEVDSAKDPDGLKPVASISGDSPVFSDRQLGALEWLAHHYVAPLSVVLDRTAPPNVPRSAPNESGKALGNGSPLENGPAPGALFAPLVEAARKRERRPPMALVTRSDPGPVIDSLSPLLESGRSALFILATAEEVLMTEERAGRRYPYRVSSVPGDAPAAAVTASWTEMRRPGRLLVGTPRVALWHLVGLGAAVVFEEGRRAMKEKQTPTFHVRELMRARARVEGFAVGFVGPTPSLELLASGAEVSTAPGRKWALVEIVDRSQEPPGSGMVASHAIASLRGALERRGTAFVLANATGDNSAMRCVRCLQLRTCTNCGSGLARSSGCARCGAALGSCSQCGGGRFEALGAAVPRIVEELRRRLPPHHVGPAGDGAPIVVGTERDLAGPDLFDLAVAVDSDGLTMGTNYRSAEEALRLLSRVASKVRSGAGRRLMVQTSSPESPVLRALRRGDAIEFLEAELVSRARLGFPPSSELLALEIRGERSGSLGDELAGLPGVNLLGPAGIDGGRRWLLEGHLDEARTRLRQLVQRWRDSGATVRVDVDPIDL